MYNSNDNNYNNNKHDRRQKPLTPKHPIDKHWFMYIRRIYLTYNVILASLLVLLQGFSFGIQLFYMFRVVEVQERTKLKNMPGNLSSTPSPFVYSNARVVCYQLSIVGLLGITCFTFASLLSKAVQFIRLIWSHDQFTKISEKFIMFLSSFRTGCSVPRWVDLLLQFKLIIVLEVVPFICGIIFMIVYRNFSIGVQAFLSIGSFATLAMVVMWWIGSIFENYKRLLMFIAHRRSYFERFKSSQHDLGHAAEEEEDGYNSNSERNMKRNEISKEDDQLTQSMVDIENDMDDSADEMDDEEDRRQDSAPLSPEQNDLQTVNLITSASTISLKKQQQEKASFIKVQSVRGPSTGGTPIAATTADAPNTRKRSDSFVSIFNTETCDVDEATQYHSVESSTVIKHSVNFVDVSKERNLWILLAWYCCLTPIGVPNLIRRFKNSKDKSKIYFLIRDVWVILGLLLLIICVSALGMIQQWKVYTLAAVSLGCLILNMFMNKLVYIPNHRPSRRRLRSAWRDSFLQRYIAVFEEVFYHSPEVVFTGCKIVMFIFVVVISVCGVFDFSDYHLIFLIPTVLCAYICGLYILRFNYINYAKWIKEHIPNCFYIRRWKKSAITDVDNTAEEQEHDQQQQQQQQQDNTENGTNEVPLNNRVNSPTLSETSGLLNRLSIRSKADSFLIESQQVPGYLHVPFEHPLFRILSVFTFTSLLIVVMIALLIMTSVSISWSAGLVQLGMMFSVCFILFKRFEQDAADSLLGFFLFYVILLGCVFILGGLNDNANIIRNYAKVGIHPNTTQSLGYEICSRRWHGYSIIDFGFFANLAYSPDPYWTHDFNVWFPNCPDCKVVARYNETIYFYDLYVPSRNLSIVGVRGTTTPQDMIQDLDIWKEAVLLQGVSLVGPFVTFWPEQLTVGIIYWIYRIELFTMNPSIEAERFYYQVLDDYIEDIKTQRNVILVGHSLGGGLAKIVGARHGLISIAFSAPGVVWSRRKLGLSIENINRVDINVKPGVDLVARVDKGGGLIQNIDCDKSFVECHSLLRTQQTLLKACGDGKRGRWIE